VFGRAICNSISESSTDRSKTTDLFLILEDDIDVEADIAALLKQALESLPKDWEMFLLGHCDLTPVKTYATFCKTLQFSCAHAYVIRNSTVASKLIRWSNTVESQVSDSVWINPVERGELIVYASYPRHLVVQVRKTYGSNIGVGPIPEVLLKKSLRKLLNS
jgi:hypothetical protein